MSAMDHLKCFGIVRKSDLGKVPSIGIDNKTSSQFSVFDRRVLLAFPLTSSGAKSLHIYERPEIQLSADSITDCIHQYETFCSTRRPNKSSKVITKNKQIAHYLKNVRKRYRVFYNPPKKRLGPTTRILNQDFRRYSPFFRYSFTPRERRQRWRQLEFGLTHHGRVLLQQVRSCRVVLQRINPVLCRAYQDLGRVRIRPMFPRASKAALPRAFKPRVTLSRLREDQIPVAPATRRPALRFSRTSVTDYIDLDEEKEESDPEVVFSPKALHRPIPPIHNVDLDEEEDQPCVRTPILSISRITFDQVASAMVSLKSVFQRSLLQVSLSRSVTSIKSEPIDKFPEVVTNFQSSLQSNADVVPLTSIKVEPTVAFLPNCLPSNELFVQPQQLPPTFLDPEEITFFPDTGPLVENVQDLESTENASITSSSATSAIASSDLSQRNHKRLHAARLNRSPIKEFLLSNAYRKYINNESSRKTTSLPEETTKNCVAKTKRVRRSDAALKRLGLSLDSSSRLEKPRTRSQNVSRASRHRL